MQAGCNKFGEASSCCVCRLVRIPAATQFCWHQSELKLLLREAHPISGAKQSAGRRRSMIGRDPIDRGGGGVAVNWVGCYCY